MIRRLGKVIQLKQFKTTQTKESLGILPFFDQESPVWAVSFTNEVPEIEFLWSLFIYSGWFLVMGPQHNNNLRVQ